MTEKTRKEPLALRCTSFLGLLELQKNTLQTSVKFDGSRTLSFTDILQITQSDEKF